MSAPVRCEACGVGLLDDSAYCHGCGRPVAGPLPGFAATDGEHKPITVVFVDAFGSIGLDERLDAEQWHDVMDSFFGVVSTAVQHFGGTIDRLTGEGIKILFGAPVALESHATHACHAALHIRDRLGDLTRSFRAHAGGDFAVRMGIASGEVVFGRVGVGGTGTFTSQGHVAGLAARLQQLAEPGRIYLTQETATLVADYFDLHEVGELPVRNTSRPVRAFELRAARDDRTRLDVARERGLSPFLGREREIAELDESLRVATRDGLRIVGIVGEPGIGKSRLVEEFLERQKERGLWVQVTRCVEHARSIPFHTTVPFLRAALRVPADADARTMRAELAETLRALDPDLLDTLPVLATAFGIAEPAEAELAIASGTPAIAMARVLRALIAARGPVAPSIFVVDDQQWMDAGADTVFGELVRHPPRAPVLVVVTYRPDHHRAWMRSPHFRELAMRPLDDATALRLVHAIMGEDRSLRECQARLVEQAAGNPFFIEESVSALAAAGVIEGRAGGYRLRDASASLAFPDSLHAVLASRIDRLGEREKAVLQAAAVIGREFAVSLLAAVSGLDPEDLASVLRAPEAGGFVSAVGWGDEPVYLFRHPLLQQTAYRSLLRDDRARSHRAVAAELARRRGTRSNPHAGRIAEHLEAAGDALEAARWHRRAAWQTVGWDPAQSYLHWRRILACTAGPLDDDGARLRLLACEAVVRLGLHNGLAPDEGERLVTEGRLIAHRFGDVHMSALLSSALGSLRGCTGDLDACTAHQREALQHAEGLKDAGLMLTTGAQLLFAHRVAGNIDEGLRLADRLLATCRPENARALGANLVSLRQLELARAMLLLDRGRLDDGTAELTRVIAAMRDDSLPAAYAWALSLTATVVRYAGDPAPVLAARIEDAHARARRFAMPGLVARTLCSLATLRLCQSLWDDARACAEEACATMNDLGHTFYVDFDPRLLLSYARFGLGDIAGARGLAQEALQHAFASGSRLGQIDTMAALGRILVRYGSLAEIEQGRSLLRHGLALVRRCRARSREPLFWLELAGLERRAGHEPRAVAFQRRGVRRLVAINAYGFLPRTPGLMSTPPERAHLRDTPP